MKYIVRGHAICVEGQDWPPLLKDYAASALTLKLVVDALNAYQRERLLLDVVEAAREWAESNGTLAHNKLCDALAALDKAQEGE